MKKPTYEEQFNKLTEAYIKGEVNPFSGCNCFVGNLLNNVETWSLGRKTRGSSKFTDNNVKLVTCDPYEVLTKAARACIKIQSGDLYTLDDIIKLESLFLSTYNSNGGDSTAYINVDDYGNKIPITATEQDEEALFKAFDVTLDLLKTIHEEKGEIIEHKKIFKQRQLI